jgi:hypothetical protein
MNDDLLATARGPRLVLPPMTGADRAIEVGRRRLHRRRVVSGAAGFALVAVTGTAVALGARQNGTVTPAGTVGPYQVRMTTSSEACLGPRPDGDSAKELAKSGFCVSLQVPKTIRIGEPGTMTFTLCRKVGLRPQTLVWHDPDELSGIATSGAHGLARTFGRLDGYADHHETTFRGGDCRVYTWTWAGEKHLTEIPRDPAFRGNASPGVYTVLMEVGPGLAHDPERDVYRHMLHARATLTLVK